MKILIADDEVIFRVMLKRCMWVEDPRAEIWEAEEGERAMRLASEHHPDLVLMDLGLPRLGGLLVMQRIKAEHPNVRIVAVSSFEGKPYEEVARAYGADSFLSKFRYRSAVRSLLSRAETSPIGPPLDEEISPAASEIGGMPRGVLRFRRRSR